MNLKNSTSVDLRDLPSNSDLLPWPITLGEYEDLTTFFVQKYIEENYAKRIPVKAISFGSK
jgi:hypothetical protein